MRSLASWLGRSTKKSVSPERAQITWERSSVVQRPTPRARPVRTERVTTRQGSPGLTTI